MARSVRAAAVLGALLGGFVTYWLYPDPLLAVNAGFCWAGGSALLVGEREAWSGGDGASLVDGLPAVLVIAVGLFGVHAGLGIPEPLRWALVVLVVGGILFAVGVGILLGRRSAENPDRASS